MFRTFVLNDTKFEKGSFSIYKEKCEDYKEHQNAILLKKAQCQDEIVSLLSSIGKEYDQLSNLNIFEQSNEMPLNEKNVLLRVLAYKYEIDGYEQAFRLAESDFMELYSEVKNGLIKTMERMLLLAEHAALALNEEIEAKRIVDQIIPRMEKQISESEESDRLKETILKDLQLSDENVRKKNINLTAEEPTEYTQSILNLQEAILLSSQSRRTIRSSIDSALLRYENAKKSPIREKYNRVTREKENAKEIIAVLFDDVIEEVREATLLTDTKLSKQRLK